MPRNLTTVLILAGLAAAPAPAAAQQAARPVPAVRAAAGATYSGRAGHTTVRLERSTAEPRIDGRIEEAAWRGAPVLTGFSQYQPVDGVPAADSTEVRVLYTHHAIYFAIRAFEPHGEVLAALTDRDRIGGNDHVQIILDTFNDRRRALFFSVNALGVQSDGTFSDAEGMDLSPDFLFESHGRVTATGYEVELRIPFKSMRFQQTPVQDWGIQVIRRVMHAGHEQTWTAVERGAPSFLGQSGTLAGLADLRQGLVLDVNPVMTQRSVGAPGTGAAGGWDYDHERPEFGGNVRWGVTPNVSLNATVNPDFSQVEADVGQVVYDPRQALAFPEKRPFFLEANENFQVPNALIYTRRIVAPEAAVKVSGKVGGLNVGALTAVDDGDLVGGGSNPLYNLLRVRTDVGPQSNLGMVYTDRVQGSSYNRVLGVDSRLVVGDRYVLSGQVAGSFTGGDGWRSHGRPLFDFALAQTGRASGFNLVVEGVHPEFVAGAGFVPRAGIAHASFVPRRTWFPASGGLVESVTFTPILDGTWEWDRFTRGTEPNDIKVNSRTSLQLRGGWHTALLTWTESFKYPDYLYTNYFIEQRDAAGEVTDTVPFSGTDRLTNLGLMLVVGTPQWRRFSANAEILGGQDDNFDEWSSAWILFSTLEGEWRPTDRARLNARFLEQRVYRKSDGSLVRLRTIPRVKLEYQLSRPVFVRFVGQYDGLKVDALRDDARTGDPILIRTSTGFRPASAMERGGFRMDWLFSYQPSPGTVLFAGYGSSLGGDELFRPRELERVADGFFVKLSYLFRM